jgi:hypothetical protein
MTARNFKKRRGDSDELKMGKIKRRPREQGGIISDLFGSELPLACVEHFLAIPSGCR